MNPCSTKRSSVAGLKWGDATPVYMGFAQHPPALANGAVDASITNEPTSTFIQRQGSAIRFAGNDEFYPNQQTAVLLYGDPFIKNRRPVALKFMRAYLRAVRFYNDALADGRLAGPNGPEVVSILTKYSALKDADLYRVITPPAIDPNGVGECRKPHQGLAILQGHRPARRQGRARRHRRHQLRRRGGRGARTLCCGKLREVGGGYSFPCCSLVPAEAGSRRPERIRISAARCDMIMRSSTPSTAASEVRVRRQR